MISGLVLLMVFLTGLLSFLSPCIIPMVIVYLSAITGFSMEELLEQKDSASLKSHVMASTIVFVASFTIVFTIVGGTAGYAGSFFKMYAETMTRVGGFLLILFGLYIMGLFKNRFYKISFLARVRERIEIQGLSKRFKKDSGMLGYLGVFVIGFVFALVCSHCIGPTLYPILILATTTASVKMGMTVLFVFSIGLGIPFIITALFLNSTIDSLQKFKKHYRLFAFLMGLIIILFGVMMITGRTVAFSSFFDNIIPWELGLKM